MKRNKFLILAAVSICFISACAKEVPQISETPATHENAQTETLSADATNGQILFRSFQNAVTSNSKLTVQEIADIVITNDTLPFDAVTSPVEPGFLAGFGNVEITGFQEGIMFGPVISTIPFIGYVFELDESTDVDEFVELLEDNGNLRWNICTSAEELVAGSEGNKVFFVMCTERFEE